jgi:hypothetical protein
MANIAFVDHYYHKKTRSTQFLPDILRCYGHIIDFFWDESWRGGDSMALDSLLNYDVIIMFQACCNPRDQYYRLRHDNIIHIPMLDQFGTYQGAKHNYSAYWEVFQGCKIISFSSVIHGLATLFGLRSLHIRYYQPPEREFDIPGNDGLHGFFWLRHAGQVTWPMVRELIGGSRFDSFHLHIALDPHSPTPVLPTEEEIARHNITTSTWFENKEDFHSILSRANIFFASRAEEGIGQSFLEAMARGQCVVSPDNGTMNEYIVHGLNGLLYSAKSLAPLDFSNALELGRNALRSVEAGHTRWREQEERLVDFILTPSSVLYKGYYRHAPLDRPLSATEDGQTAHIRPSLLLRQRLSQWRILRYTERLWRPVWRKIKTLFENIGE